MKRQTSIKDVAARAGISKSTVSRVVSDRGGSVSPKTLDAVNAAIKELGYTRNTLAAGLRTSKTYLVLFVVPDATNPFWSEIARAAQERLEEDGYFLVVGSTDWREDREKEFADLVRAGRFDGLIVNSVTDEIGDFSKLEVPMVIVGERPIKKPIDTVGSATYAEVTTALDYLYDMGHRKIAIVVSDSEKDLLHSRRSIAYLDFLKAKGLPVDKDLVFSEHLSDSNGENLVRKLLALEGWRKRVSAILCGNDLLAIATMNALRSAGIQPGRDVSIVGIDDIPAAALAFPALTTIRKPRAEMGKAAAEFLLSQFRAPDRTPEKLLFDGELVVRDSVAKVEVDS